MLRLAADENVNADVVGGLRRRFPDLDRVRMQDVGLSGADDPTVLAWAAREQRVLLTHDVSTLVGLALTRVADGRCRATAAASWRRIHVRLSTGNRTIAVAAHVARCARYAIVNSCSTAS